MGIRCADHVTPLYPQKLALTSPTGGGRSVGIVRSRTKATEFSLVECLSTTTATEMYTFQLSFTHVKLHTFLCTFLKPRGYVRNIYVRSRNCEKRLFIFVMSVCLSVCPHGTTRLLLDGFSSNLVIEYFSKICRESSSFTKI